MTFVGVRWAAVTQTGLLAVKTVHSLNPAHHETWWQWLQRPKKRKEKLKKKKNIQSKNRRDRNNTGFT